MLKQNHSYKSRICFKCSVISPSLLDLCLNLLQVINLSCALPVDLKEKKTGTYSNKSLSWIKQRII